MSFVERLPVEVTHDILLLCMHDVKRNRTVPALSDYPFIFTSICKGWSQAALSCPLLWSSISVLCWCSPKPLNRTYTLMPRHSPPLPVISRWIERSGNMPLSFDVTMWHHGREYGSREIDTYTQSGAEILKLLIPHHCRWRRVALNITPSTSHSPSNLLLLIRAESFPLLEDVTVRESLSHMTTGETAGARYRVDTFSPGIVHLLTTSPRLKTMTIDKVYGYSKGIAILDNDAIPWTQLRKICVSFPSSLQRRPTIMDIPRLLKLLESCERLEDLTLECIEGDFPLPATQYQPATHHFLKSLNVQRYSTDVFKYITLPRLNSLALSLHCAYPHAVEDNQQAGQAFATFIERSRCQLRKFVYHEGPGAYIDRPPVVEMLWAVSRTIEELDLSMRPEIPKQVLCALTTPQYALLEDSDEASHITFPNLFGIKLTSCLGGSTRGSRWVGGYLSNMVESRWDPPVGIARILEVDVRFEVLGPSSYANSEEEIARWRMDGPSFIREDIRQLRELAKRGRIGDDGRARVTLTWVGRDNAEYEYIESYVKERYVGL